MNMDGKSALVIGATGGIGAAVLAELAARGAATTGISRADGFDLTQPRSIDPIVAELSGSFDVVIVATGKLNGAGNPPEKSLKALTADAMTDQYTVNCIGPAMVLRHLPRLLERDKRAFCGVLSARVGSIGDNRLGGWYSYRAAKAALNQVTRSAAIELARTHKQAVLACLHPGTVATRFTEGFSGRYKLLPEEAARRLVNVLTALGPHQTGTFWDQNGTEVPW